MPVNMMRSKKKLILMSEDVKRDIMFFMMFIIFYFLDETKFAVLNCTGDRLHEVELILFFNG